MLGLPDCGCRGAAERQSGRGASRCPWGWRWTRTPTARPARRGTSAGVGAPLSWPWTAKTDGRHGAPVAVPGADARPRRRSLRGPTPYTGGNRFFLTARVSTPRASSQARRAFLRD